MGKDKKGGNKEKGSGSGKGKDKGKGKAADKDTDDSSSKPSKGAQSINVRHILVRSPALGA
jgi:hypothetical protein